MKKLFMAVIALMMTISASAQFYIYFSDGTVAKVDSISMIAPGDPEQPNPSAGIGTFSVAADKKVTFSKGNLQYTQSTDTWSFAENQWDYIGTDNVTGGSVSSDSTYGDSKEGTALADKIDLFGWSTSSTKFGVSTSTSNSDYSGSFVDWGTNKIGNDAPNTWRTLSSDEWDYVVFDRPNASSLKGVAQVNGVNGLILLPDNWVCPSDITFKSGFHNYDVDAYAAYQTFTVEQWSKLEAAGAVFLPAAGFRKGSDVNNVQGSGSYWSATESEYNSYDTDYLDFYEGGAVVYYGHRYYGRSVRLVKDIEGSGATPDIPDTPDTPTEPEEPTNPSAGIGTFSVSADKQVTFSQGNLQYHPANDEWRFAEDQTDYIGVANNKCSSTYDGWLDLFGWSTSTSNFGVSTSTSNSAYSGSFVDWGTNQIGADAPNTWRTLTYNEWVYVVFDRPNASSLKGVAQVNGVNGLILLPDNWICPAGVTFKSGFQSNYGVKYADYQTFTADQWSKLEAAGAVFLPASGRRDGSTVDNVQYDGYYWSATEDGSSYAYILYFDWDVANMSYSFRCYGLSVRLVKDIEGGGATPDTPDTPIEPEEPEDLYNGHEYVDLGLSVKWATCNVGATKPEEYGDYFAWGETQQESNYDWSTYKWCNGSIDTQTKYCTNSDYGTVDNKTQLELGDDAARANWGGSWRMPTRAEQDELRNNCTWIWTTQNGVNGYKVTSKSNGNSIFLPAAGYRYGSSLYYAGSDGYYWSSSLSTDYPSIAYYLSFYSGSVDWYYYYYRYFGFTVRPVCQ